MNYMYSSCFAVYRFGLLQYIPQCPSRLLYWHQDNYSISRVPAGKLVPLSSTWRKFDPDTAYGVCMSVSLGFPYMVSISPGFLYMVMLQTFKSKHHCSGRGVAMGCYGHSIVPGAAIVTSQWYGRYCFTEYARTRVGHLPKALWKSAARAGLPSGRWLPSGRLPDRIE